MAHIHSVYDTDPHFSIDSTTRVITNQSDSKTVIIQNDHNSERFTFEVPRYIDGHDLSTCNKVQVHYINIATDNIVRQTGVYEVTDLQLSPEDESIVICSWLISKNATSLIGTLNFVLRFACMSANKVDYVWNTAVHSGIAITTGIDNSEDIAESYADVLEGWYLELIAASTSGVNVVTDAANATKEQVCQDITEHGEAVVSSVAQKALTSVLGRDDVGQMVVSISDGVLYVSVSSQKNYVTESQVDVKIAGLVDSSPETLNTLNELAAALGDDPNFATTIAQTIGELKSQALLIKDFTIDETTGMGTLITESYTPDGVE